MPKDQPKEKKVKKVQSKGAAPKKKKGKKEKKEEATHFGFLGTFAWTDKELENYTNEFITASGNASASEDKQATMKELLTALVEETGTLNDQLNLPKSQIEGIYNLGYQAYNQGNYKEAVNVFRLLYMIDPLNEKYLFSLGLSLEKQKLYSDASSAYMMCTFLDPESPIGIFRSGVCFLEMGEKEAAKQMFHVAQQRCGEDERYKTLKERAHLFYIGIENNEKKAKSKKKKASKVKKSS